MWVQLGAATGALIVVIALLKMRFSKRSQGIDVGSVSEAWLAENRGRRGDSY